MAYFQVGFQPFNLRMHDADAHQKPPSRMRVAAGAFGFLTLIQFSKVPSDTAHSFSLTWVGVGGPCITQALYLASHLKAGRKLGV